MDERIPTDYHANELSATCIVLHSPYDNATFTLEPVRDNVFRVTFTTETHPVPPHPSIVKPDVQLSIVPTLKETDDASFLLQTSPEVTATLCSRSAPMLSIALNGVQLYSDLPNRSYVLNGPGASRYGSYNPTTLHLGLGERAAPFDLSNRTFTLSALDAAEYDAHRTDPLYKHIPLLIRATPSGCVGLFSTSYSRGTWSVGGEIDALWGRYEVMRQDYGGLELYFIVAPSLKCLVQSYAGIVGYPRMIPRWALGYLASSTGYAESDNPPAQTLLSRFPGLCRQYDIPCSAMHLSSGYTISVEPPNMRNVFTMNRQRFPDPKGLFKEMSKAGIRIIANVKPYVLETHPAFQGLADQRAFFETIDGGVAVTRLWSAGLGQNGRGSWLDMTSSAAQQWWYSGIKSLIEMGVAGIWNDNNEFALSSDKHLCCGTDKETDRKTTQVGMFGRMVNTDLMGMVSLKALSDCMPCQKTLLLTRSATARTMQYANSSWSGDNWTSWDTLLGNNAMGLTAGLCLLQSYGHDCGGFAGPRPTPKLFLRWVQLAILSPRFCIHSWKPTKDDPSSASNITEPWTYSSVLPQVREAIKRRYELIPYLYELCFRSALEAEPLQRWVGWGPYDQDANVWHDPILRNGERQFFLGDAFIVGGVYEEDAKLTTVYLPSCEHYERSANWRETYYDDGFLSLYPPQRHFPSGRWVTVPTPLSNIAVFPRVGSVVPVGLPCVTTACPQIEPNLHLDDWRGVEIYPPPLLAGIRPRTYVGMWREDDGITNDVTLVNEFKLSYQPTQTKIVVSATCKSMRVDITWGSNLWVILPKGEQRPVAYIDRWGGNIFASGTGCDARGRSMYHVEVTFAGAS